MPTAPKTPPASTVLRILPSAPWAYPEMEADFRAAAPVWREVTEEFYDQAQQCLPPISGQLGWMVSEPLTHGSRGAVCAGFVHASGRYFGRYVARIDFDPACREFFRFLATTA